MNLQTFFSENNNLALGFSGGVDSSYLLYAGMKYGAKIKAYYVKTAFQPEFELNDAQRMAKLLHADFTVIETDVLSIPHVAENPANRCYYCKTAIFSLVTEQAKKDGYPLVIDGTNASDDVDDRPGMKALHELSVRSPLRECGITKPEVRRLSREAGLFTWDKPAYACLATRVPTGEIITADLLKKVERAENSLFSLGFTDFRVRVMGNTAKLQLPLSQMPLVLEQREEILKQLKGDFSAILMDLEARS